MRRALLMLMPIALAAMAGGCGSDPDAVDGRAPDAGVDASAIEPVCLLDEDCPLGLACIAGDCKERPDAGHPDTADASAGCFTDEDCPDLRYACARTTFTCVRVPGRCLDGADCEPGFACDPAERLCLLAQDAGSEPDCLDGEARGCGVSKVGECRFGVQRCADGAFGPCEGAVVPSEEICDGLDNDCNGDVDEGIDFSTDILNCGACDRRCQFPHATPLCTEGSCRMGPCEAGWVDLDGAPATGCEYQCTPTNGGSEVCDGLDNDCDGEVDDGVCTPVLSCPADQTVGPNTTVTLATTGSSPISRPVICSWMVVSRPATSNGAFSNQSCSSASYFADVVGTHQLRFTVTDENQGLSASCDTRITVNALGDLWVELTWDVDNDIDLHLQHPSAGSSHLAAGWSTSPYDCYYSNKTPSWDLVGTQDDPSLDRDDMTAKGPENTRINQPSTSHAYVIGVHTFKIENGATTATVKLYCGNVLITSQRRLLSTAKDMWVVGTVQFHADRTCAFTSDGYVFNKP